MRNRKNRKSKKIFQLLFLFILILGGVAFLKFYLEKTQNITIISPVSFTNNNNNLKKLETLLKQSNISFGSLSSSSSSYFVKFKDGEEVILDSNKPLEQQISSLQLVLSRLTIEGKRFVRLDLRYDKPVIQFTE
ncbi:MAG: hypothetical protein Q8P10_03705 [bacterium]|nr:hypothetical protein [bacterium]